MDKMTHGSLFSGRGGFDLGAESCGIENIWNCEIDRWLRHKLKRISPNAKQYSDIRTVKFPKCPTVLSAGFPCQDISVANTNSKKGFKGTRSGLWFETERIIDEAKDFLWLVVDEYGLVIDAGPFQADFWKGGIIPIWEKDLIEVGKYCPIHCAFMQNSFLKHKIEKIETI